MTKSIINKMFKYNSLISKAYDLKRDIEDYLEEKYSIDPMNEPFNDGVCAIYEMGTEYLDIEKILDIAEFIKDFSKKIGENPDGNEILNHFEK